MSSTSDFFSPRLYSSRIIYLNKSNTKWILIGILPGDVFLPVAYICGKDGQAQIPDLETFITKVADLAGLSSSIIIKSPIGRCGDLTVTKSDFGGCTYKIYNSTDNQRCVYVATSTLEYLRCIAKPLIDLFNNLDAHLVSDEFEKIVVAVATTAELMECADYQMLESEMYQTKPPEVNMSLFCETILTFRNYFYRRVRNLLKQK